MLTGGAAPRPELVVVCGPTATGKTALGVALAHALDGEVVSADSMQLYRGMDIGTAKPTAAEREGVPHHMLDVAGPEESWSVARYVSAAGACVDDILRRGKRPILVGGTGLYIDSLLAGREFAPFSGRWRRELEAQLASEGVEALYARLREVDPRRAEKLAPGDARRIVRALEVWYETGCTITEHDRLTRERPPRYTAVRLGLSFARREDLYARIDRRVEEMMARGLVEEVQALLDRGVSPGCTAMQAIGYKELAAALRTGGSLGAAEEEIKLRSRQYAKRQLTWLRRSEGVHWHLWDSRPDFSAAVLASTNYLKEVGL